MNAQKLLTALMGHGLTIDFKVGRKTFQISGLSGMVGFWERFFPKDDHPYRREAGKAEIQRALDSAKSFKIWTIGGQFRRVRHSGLKKALAPFELE